MKAIIYRKYGPPEVLRLAELEKPVPKNHELLIRIRATAVNSADCRLRKADPFLIRFLFGLLRPKKPVLGLVLSGEVEATGNCVTLFSIGDKVFGMTEMALGTYAEYITFSEKGALSIKPENLTHGEAASLPFGWLTAWYFLQRAGVTKGHTVMVYGASGSVGTAAVQLASYLGAKVTGVCSAANSELVKLLGAEKVLDYRSEAFLDLKDRYDVIFETVGKCPMKRLAQLVKPGGIIILGAIMPGGIPGAYLHSLRAKFRLITGTCKASVRDMAMLKNHIEAGIIRPVIDRSYPLEECASAHRYADTGHKRGNLVLTV